jgi:hemerythrin
MAMWKDSLKIGVPLIDDEHKELCERTDQLFAACSQGKGKAEIIKTLEFLEGYTLKHFADEEKLQRASAYPKCKEHKELHDFFKLQISDLKKEIAANGASITVVSKTNYFLMNWLISHIQREDKELAEYLK